MMPPFVAPALHVRAIWLSNGVPVSDAGASATVNGVESM